LIIAAANFAASCDEKENAGPAPGQVINIEHQPDFGSIVFTWLQPVGDENYYYTDIRYEVDGVEYSKKATKFIDSTTVEGLTSNDSIDFRFYSVSKTGVYSKPVVYRAASYAPPFDLVAQSIRMFTDSVNLRGVYVSWENRTGKKVTVEVSYIDKSGALATKAFSATEAGEALISDIATANARKFSVAVRDARQNVSGKREFTMDVFMAAELDRTLWSVPGYDETSRYETVGYSSQALNEATTANPNNGSIMAMFDGNVSTFWHAAWSAPNTVYPHWFIVDLGKEYSVTHVEMTRRQGNSSAQKGFQLLTCTENGATDATDPTTWNWQSQGEFDFDPTINTPQNYRVNDNPRARYLKVYMDAKYKGSGNYAMISEFGAYAIEEATE
jgi:hypothetical protein